jgi:hypothetical protein
MWTRVAQPVTREQHVASHTLLCCPQRHFKRENAFRLFPKQSGDTTPEEVSKNCEVFIYGDVYYITNSFCKFVLKIATP